MGFKFAVSDIVKSRKIVKFLPILIISIICGTASSVFASYSNLTAKENVCRLISESALADETGTLPVSFNFNSGDSRANYYNAYNISTELRYMRVTPHAFNSYCGFFTENRMFSDSFAYSCSDIFESGSISLLVSPANSIFTESGNYVHEIWNFDLMFEKNTTQPTDGTKSSNFCYITFESATYYLQQSGVSSPSLDDYKSLAGKTIPISFNNYLDSTSEVLNWTISNIIVENERSDYFKKRLGNFIACYVGLPTFDYPSFSLDFGHSLFMCGKYLETILDSFNLPNDITYSILGGEATISADDFGLALERFSASGFSNKVYFSGIFAFLVVASVLCIFFYLSCYLNLKKIFKFEALILVVSSLIVWIAHLLYGSFLSYDSLAFLVVSCCAPVLSAVIVLIIRKINKRIALPYDVIKC